jgi:UDP-N-acetylglucosamine acyltransferase
MTYNTDQETNIHPTAIVSKKAQVGKGVQIEPYAIIKDNVILEDGVSIKAHAYIDGHTRIGSGTTIWPSASIGTKTQDLKFRGETTYVSIGKNCDIREFVTINSSTQEGSTVSVGDNCLIMAYCHIAHNCSVGNHVIMSNAATLAGHVTVHDHAIIAGMTAVHQFCTIGSYAMVGGMSRITHDVPPYTLGGGIPYKFGGINLVGLERHNFPLETRRLIARAFKLVYRSNYTLDEALSKITQELPEIPELVYWVNFCRSTKRGLLGIQSNTPAQDAEEALLELDEDLSTS